jgi:phosphohistidine phosphatase
MRRAVAFGQTGTVRFLTIVRHAKSKQAVPGESDYDRRLNSRGRRECEQLREWAQDSGALGRFGPTTALVSSAARTRETFERAFDGTAFVAAVEFSDLIYNGHRDVSAEDVLSELTRIDPVTSSLVVVAHNPTVYELVSSLASELPESLRDYHYPLGGAYVLALPGDGPIGLERYELVASFVPG